MSAPRIRLAYLDGLRALAALYVVGFHAVLGFAERELPPAWKVLRRAFAFGHEAVAVFIVLSGYCLMLPIVRRSQGELRAPLGPFLRRRARRILPPYYAALGASLALLWLVPSLSTPTRTIWNDSLPGLEWRAVTSHLLVVHNWSKAWGYQINGPLWSVASEWQIYFFLPLVLLPTWRRVGMFGALVIASLLGYAPLLLFPRSSMVAIPWYLLLFTLGMSAAAIGFGADPQYQRWRQQVSWRAWARVSWWTCLALGLGAAQVWFAFKPLTDAMLGLATATLLISTTRDVADMRPSWLLRLLEARPLVALGHFSYSLYLTHLPVLALCFFWLRARGLSQVGVTLSLLGLGSLLSIGCAYGFYKLVEQRFIASGSSAQ